MADYWGARAYTSSGGPNGEGTYYHLPSDDPDKVWTEQPSSDGSSGPTIEQIYAQISNAKPAHLSALADQWQNMYNLLEGISIQLFQESITLDTEHWKSSAAKEAFLRSGPGQSLAYLDEWMTSALANQSALRAVVSIVKDFQGQMETLWKEYQDAVQDAQDVSGGRKAWEYFWHGNLTGADTDYDAVIAKKKLDQTEEARKQYNQKAQVKAWGMAQQMFDPFSSLASGHGPVFMPPDAVLNQPGHPPLLSPPGSPSGPSGPPGTPGGPPPPPSSDGAVKHAPAPPPGPAKNLDQTKLQEQLQQFLQQLNPPPPAPAPPPAAPPAPPPGAPTAPPALPLDVTALANAAANLTANVPGLTTTSAPNLSAPPGSNSPFQNANLARSNGILQAKTNTPSLPESSSPSLRSPAAPPTGGRSLNRPSSPRSAPGSESEGAPNPGRSQRGVLGRSRGGAVEESQAGLEDPFGRTSSGTTPPVLNNKRPNRARPGSAEELTPETRSGSPRVGRPGVSRPVLGSRGASPAESERARSKKPGRGAPGQGAPGSEWLGTEEVRAGAGAPVLDAPEQAVTGAAVSGLEEVPSALRGHSQPAAAGAGSQRRAVPPELARRTSRSTVEGTPAVAPDESGEQQVISDEEAFSVQTPGGGVLGGHQEDRAYRQEPRATLGGS